MIQLNMTEERARKVYGLIAYCFNIFQIKGQNKFSEETIMALIPVSEALAVQLDRANGQSVDLSDISAEALAMFGETKKNKVHTLHLNDIPEDKNV